MGEKSRVFRICLCSLLGMKAEAKERSLRRSAKSWRIGSVGMEGGMICSQPTCRPGRSALWVSREILMELGAEIKQ